MLNATQNVQTKFVPVRSLDQAKLHKHSDDLKKRISSRAYEIFEYRGKETGHDVDDWLKAEAEVLWELH